jgi:hypothetical protein
MTLIYIMLYSVVIIRRVILYRKRLGVGKNGPTVYGVWYFIFALLEIQD